MPTISRFFGIAIRMYWEAGNPHHRPHFHAYYQDYAAVFAIDTATGLITVADSAPLDILVNPSFDIDEEPMSIGISVMAGTALRYLSRD